MLHDRARIHVRAGAGGDGCMSFRREAKVPRGGPDGGDGGRGGEVVLVCDESLRDLHGFRRRAQYHAGRGGHGEGALKHGADGETLVIRVPPGTEARGAACGQAGEGDRFGGDDDGSGVSGGSGGSMESDDLQGRRWELLAHGQRATIARGGSGGRGNKRFATSTRQAPRFAERGLPGEEGWIELRLRLLADVGLVGLPNAGKSSLLSRMTRAAPKIADYPFTTLSPVLGVLEDELERRQLVVADIPGLIEGASDGAGLGHDFLAHVERTRLLVHVLDIAPELSGDANADAVANHATIEHELTAYDERLARLPRVLALSKVDLLTPERAREAVAEWQRRLGPDVPVLATSSATRVGVRELGELLLRVVPELAPGPGGRAEVDTGVLSAMGAAAAAATTAAGAAGESERERELEQVEHMVFRPGSRDGGRGYTVQRLGEGSFAVNGRGIERLLARYDVNNEDALAYLEERLRRIGVLDALAREGFTDGDEVQIAGVAFELDPDTSARSD
jgi:GTPase